MKLGLINSAWSQAGKWPAYSIDQTTRIGCATVDIQVDPLDISQAERDLIRRAAADNGLAIKSVCCVAVGLVDFNPSVQRFSVDRVKAYLDLCREFAAE